MPAWVTENVRPAIVRAPFLELVLVFAAALKLTDPLPVPVLPAVIVSQFAPLTAAHVQPVPAVTFVLPVPPVAPTAWDVGDKVNAQVPACETDSTWPPIVTVAVRELLNVFADALKPTEPFPLPDAPDVMVSQLALLVAVQVQPVPAVTLTLLDPPAAAAPHADVDSAYVQDDAKANVFESALAVDPPGPTAATSAT